MRGENCIALSSKVEKESKAVWYSPFCILGAWYSSVRVYSVFPFCASVDPIQGGEGIERSSTAVCYSLLITCLILHSVFGSVVFFIESVFPFCASCEHG